MPMRDKDWIVSDSNSTNQIGCWSISPGGGIVLANIPGNTLIIGPLTLPRTADVNSPQQFEVNDDWTLEAVVGRLHFFADPQGGDSSWRAMLDVRIEVMDASTGGVPAVPTDYALDNLPTANRAFVGHWSSMWTRQGGWLEPERAMKSTWDVEVNTKTRRRVAPGQVVAMAIQWLHEDGGTGNIPRLHWASRLRILGSKRV